MDVPEFPEERLKTIATYQQLAAQHEGGQSLHTWSAKAKSTVRKANNVTKGVKAVSTGVKAVNIGQQATSVSNFASLAAATVTGASATGFGLLVVGGVMMIGDAVKDVVAWDKTRKHVRHLSELDCGGECSHILEGRASVQDEHDVIRRKVLPYIINKKKSKRNRKAISSFGAIAGGGLAEGMRGAVKGSYKQLRGTKGKHRLYAAQWLAHHFLTHHCELSNAIVAELYSEDEMIWLRQQRAEVVVPLLMEKMKST